MTDLEQHVDKMKVRLSQWEKSIDELESKIKTAPGKMKKEYQQQVEALKHKRYEASIKIKEMQKVNDNAGKEVNKRFENTWNSLSQTFGSVKIKIFGK